MGIKKWSDHSQRVLLLSLNFSQVVTRDDSQGQYWSWYRFPSSPSWSDAVCSHQMCRWSQTGEGELSRRWRFLPFRGTSRNWKNGLPVLHLGRNNLSTGAQAATTAKCTLDCFSGRPVCEAIGSNYSPPLTCLTWDTASTFGTPPVQKRCGQTGMNSRGWGLEHTMYVERLNKLGEKAQGASRHQYPYIKGAYGEDRARFSRSCTAEGQEAMVTSCSEGNLDQRHGKKISMLGEGVDSPPLEICKTCWRQLWAIWPNFEVRLPLSREWDYVASRSPFQPKIWYDAQYLGLYSFTSFAMVVTGKGRQRRQFSIITFQGEREIGVQLILGTTSPHL